MLPNWDVAVFFKNSTSFLLIDQEDLCNKGELFEISRDYDIISNGCLSKVEAPYNKDKQKPLSVCSFSWDKSWIAESILFANTKASFFFTNVSHSCLF